MKKSIFRKLLAIAGCVTLFCALDVSLSQAATKVTADANCSIIQPISIELVQSLDFGVVYASAGTIIVKTDGTVDGSSSGTQKAGNVVKAASFTVKGEGGQNFGITLDNVVALTKDSDTIALSGLNSDAPTALPAGTGEQSVTVNVGGTITIGATQASGTYLGHFDATVNYN